MSKCIGCGSLLTLNKDSVGYTKSLDNKLCERCFRIRNYNEYKIVTKDNSEYYKIIDNIDNSLTLLIIDLFDIPSCLEQFVSHLNNNVLLVLAKFDLIPSTNEERFINYFKRNYHINFIDSIIISSKNNFHLDELYDKIRLYNNTGRVYFVGFTNAGKSSLINKLIYNYANDDTVITTSNLPSTTLSTIEINLDDMTLIDTPGIINSDSIVNYIDGKILKRVIPNGKIKPIVYQVKKIQIINIDNMIELESSNNNLVLYFSNKLDIKRCYKKLDGCYNTIDITENGVDIVFPGLGFIKVTKKECIKIKTTIKYYIRKSMI